MTSQNLALAGFLDFETTLTAAFASRSGDLTTLPTVATGVVLANAEDAITKMRGQQHVLAGSPTISNASATLGSSTDSVVITACRDDSTTEILNTATNAVVDRPSDRYKTATTMVLVAGQWKAATATTTGEC